MLAHKLRRANRPFRWEYRSVASDAVDRTTYTFNSVDFGSPESERYVLIHLVGHQNGTSSLTYSSLTIGGVAATEIVYNGTSGIGLGLWWAKVPTGSTGTIEITWGQAMIRTVVGVWALYNPRNLSPTVYDSTRASGVTTRTVSPTVPAGTVWIGGSCSGSAGTSCTWTNATERYDELPVGEARASSGADSTAESVKTLTANASTTLQIVSAVFY